MSGVVLSEDTIFAVASGSGLSAVTVLRISGPDAGPVLDRLAGGRPPARRAALRTLRDESGGILDHALALWFPGPKSYTGDDVTELHLHGGAAVLAAVSDALVQLGLRPAEPGEFTRRAFLAGRMDLTEAEGMADLIAAETEAQRVQALRQMEGALGALYAGWAARLTRALAQAEALIDFADEDLPGAVVVEARREIESLAGEVRAHLADAAPAARTRSGIVVAITGAPNAGKSSLVNALAGRDVAIVSPVPGTTRDPVEASLVLAGVPVTLVDTAGLRETADPIEAEGVRRARARAEGADLVMVVRDAGRVDLCPPRTEEPVRVASKIDLGGDALEGEIAVSVVTGFGLDALRHALTERVASLTRVAGSAPPTRARHVAALREATARLEAALRTLEPELLAEELRLAMRALGRITGRVGVEDLLDSIFRQFCIGK